NFAECRANCRNYYEFLVPGWNVEVAVVPADVNVEIGEGPGFENLAAEFLVIDSEKVCFFSRERLVGQRCLVLDAAQEYCVLFGFGKPEGKLSDVLQESREEGFFGYVPVA